MSDQGVVSGCVLFVLLTGLGCLALRLDRAQRPTLRCQLGLFFAAFILRFAMAIVIYQGGLVRVLKDEDASRWVKGVELHRSWVAQGLGWHQFLHITSAFFHAFDDGYYYMLGALFSVTEPARLPAAVFNGFLGALTVVLVYRIAAVLFSAAVASRVGWWLCLFPSMIIWSSQTIKEPVVLALEVFSIHALIVSRNAARPLRGILAGVAAALVLEPFRFYAAYAVLTAILAASVLPLFLRRPSDRPSLAAAATAVVLATLVAIWITFHYYGLLRNINFHSFVFLRHYYVRGGSAVTSTYDLQTPGGFVGGLLVGVAHLLLAPFPWQLAGGSLRMLLTAPEMIVWWWLFFAGVLPGLWYVLRARAADLIPILVLIALYVTFYGLIFGNIGYTFRQRVHLLPWLLMFAAVGLERRRERARSRRAREPEKL